MQFIDKGHSIREAARTFGIGTSTIMDWRKLCSQTGELNKRPQERTYKKISPDELLAYLKETLIAISLKQPNTLDALQLRFLRRENALA